MTGKAYKIGGWAALLVFVLTVIQSIIFIIYPPPSAAIDYFTLFQNNWLLGLLSLDLLLIVNYIFFVLIYLALYAALKRFNQSLAMIALIFGLMGMTLFFASREATFGMLSLSGHCNAATAEAERAMILAAGQALLTIYNGTAFDLSYIFNAIVILLFSVVILQSEVFSRFVAYLGIVMGVLMLVPPTAGMVGLTLSLLSLIPTLIWLIPVARRFFQMASSA